MLACTKQNADVVKVLVEAGASPVLKNKDGWNSFHIACREGNEAILNYLLDCNPQLWDTISKNSRTPLHTAALHGRLGATQILLRRGGFCVDMKDSCGSTPLMDALRAGCLDVADKLINTHASVHMEDCLGRQALHLAAQAGCEASVTYLVTKRGVNVNVETTTTGATAMHMAAKEGHENIIECLLHLGANINHSDKKGRTALHTACACNQDGCARVLRSHSARDVCDESGLAASSLVANSSTKQLDIR